MVNAYSFDGLLVVVMLLICTCGYIRRIPKLRQFLLTEKKGFAGIFYKASVIGTRLNKFVCLTCLGMAFWVLFMR